MITQFDDLFGEYATNVELDQIKTTNLGTLYELTYSIDMKKGVDEKAFIDSLRCRNGNLNIILCKMPEKLEKLQKLIYKLKKSDLCRKTEVRECQNAQEQKILGLFLMFSS